MKKFNLNDEKIPLAELELDMRQFELPTIFRVDFSTARENKKTEYINSERHETDETQNFIIQAWDDEVVSALEKMKLPISSLKELEIELTGDFVKVKKLMEQSDTFRVKLSNPKVLLKQEPVNKRVNDSWQKIYTWNSVKLVAEGVELQADE